MVFNFLASPGIFNAIIMVVASTAIAFFLSKILEDFMSTALEIQAWWKQLLCQKIAEYWACPLEKVVFPSPEEDLMENGFLDSIMLMELIQATEQFLQKSISWEDLIKYQFRKSSHFLNYIYEIQQKEKPGDLS